MPSQPPISVVLAQFDDLFAGGLRELINRDPSIAIVAAGIEHRRIAVVLRAHRPDVAIIDAGSLSKLAEVRDLRARFPATRLVVLAKNPSMVECAQLLAFGASACLGRDTQSRDMLNAIHLASRGLQVTSHAMAPLQGGTLTQRQLLTKREAEVLSLLQLARSNAQIALELQVGVETVRTHARNIYRKLGVSSRRELAAPSAPSAPPAPSAPLVPMPAEQAPGLRARSPRHRAATPLTRPPRGRGVRHA